MTKKCKRCECIKDVSEFSPKKDCKDKLQPYCKACRRFWGKYSRKLRLDGKRKEFCFFCDKPSIDMHHPNKYIPDATISLCRRCHRRIHMLDKILFKDAEWGMYKFVPHQFDTLDPEEPEYSI